MERVLNDFGFPTRSRVSRAVFKKLFIESGALDAADRKALSEDVSRIRWEYALKPGNTGIPAFEDEDRVCLEIAVIAVEVTARKRAERIAKFVHRAIPYPLILVVHDETGFHISGAGKRINRADKAKWVTGELQASGWIDFDKPAEAQRAFLEDCRFDRLPASNLQAVYDGFLMRLMVAGASDRVGAYKRPSSKGALVVSEALCEVQTLELEIEALSAQLKKQTQMGKRIALNTEIKARKDKIAALDAAWMQEG